MTTVYNVPENSQLKSEGQHNTTKAGLTGIVLSKGFKEETIPLTYDQTSTHDLDIHVMPWTISGL